MCSSYIDGTQLVTLRDDLIYDIVGQECRGAAIGYLEGYHEQHSSVSGEQLDGCNAERCDGMNGA